MNVKFKKLYQNAMTPEYATAGAACFDLHADSGYTIPPHDHSLIGTGLAFEIPEGYVMLVYPRSGMAANNRVNLMNCVGVIDSDYRGEVIVMLNNDGSAPVVVKQGTRIAQAMIMPVPKVELVLADRLSDTDRGAGGFGSTGE
jgi:dUTP pyrophosphatase